MRTGAHAVRCPPMRTARQQLARVGVVVLALLVVGSATLLATRPYVRAAALVARVAQLDGRLGAVARAEASAVTVAPLEAVSTRHGRVPARVYEPRTQPTRTVVLIPGIHSLGIDEPRLTSLASELAGSGLRVVAVALPDLTRYVITVDATDVVEDTIAWALTTLAGPQTGASVSSGSASPVGWHSWRHHGRPPRTMSRSCCRSVDTGICHGCCDTSQLAPPRAWGRYAPLHPTTTASPCWRTGWLRMVSYRSPRRRPCRRASGHSCLHRN